MIVVSRLEFFALVKMITIDYVIHPYSFQIWLVKIFYSHMVLIPALLNQYINIFIKNKNIDGIFSTFYHYYWDQIIFLIISYIISFEMENNCRTSENQ